MHGDRDVRKGSSWVMHDCVLMCFCYTSFTDCLIKIEVSSVGSAAKMVWTNKCIETYFSVVLNNVVFE